MKERAPRMRWLWVVPLAAGIALWLWAAHALWASTSLPTLHLPHVSETRFFSAAFLIHSASYEKFLNIDGLLAVVALVVVLILYARRGHALMSESAAGRVGTGMLLGMLGFACVWLAELPFGLAAVWWERRYDVSHQGYLGWVVENFLGLGGEFLFVCVALGIAMGIAGVLKQWWWVAAVPVFVGLAFVFTLVSPYLVPNTTPVHDPVLLAEAKALERIEGVSDARIREQQVHRETTAPNAESTGIGPTRTVLLWDTLLNGRFSRPEIRFVVAHEVAHLAHDDPLKRVGWLALFLLPATGLIAFFTRRRGGMARPEAVPVALLVLVVFQVVTMPLQNVVSRRQEAAADWSALEATRDPAAARAAFRELATASKHSPSPAGWASALYGTHPTIIDRLAMTYAWEELQSKKPTGLEGATP